MNHLAHFALAQDAGAGTDKVQSNALLVGSFLGDYVKGRLTGAHDPGVESGIRLHRAIDAYTDSHPQVRISAGRFDPGFRRYAGIMTDVLFDFFLARNWSDHYSEALDAFSTRTLTTLLAHETHLTPAARRTAARMLSYNSLANYGDEKFLANAFQHLGTRLTRSNPMDAAFDECMRNLPALERDFHAFYPELREYCGNWLRSSGTISTCTSSKPTDI